MSLFGFSKAIAKCIAETPVARDFVNALKQQGGVSSSPIVRFAHQVPKQLCVIHTNSTRQVWKNFNRLYSNGIAADLRRRASANFLQRNASKSPLFAFVGFCLSDFNGNKKEDEPPSVTSLFNYLSTDLNRFWKNENNEAVFPSKFSEYNIGERLGKPSSNAAVYSADYNGNEVALKIMFNYATSNSQAIYQAFEQEYHVLPSSNVEEDSITDDESTVLPEHPNIMKLHGKFIDDTPLLYDSVESYPVAVPQRLHNDGYGRSRTLCLVMPKYTCSLREYLHTNKDALSNGQRISIFREILEAVGHMERNGVSHRDLKSDNILIDYRNDGYQRVVITDFGCCLANENLLLPFSTLHTSRGGNLALMSPEIATAIPQDGLYLSYHKADAWTCGTLAYEIFNQDNPFYVYLNNTDYEDENLQQIPVDSGNNLIDKIVYGLLRKDPENRLSAGEASTLMALVLHVIPEWITFPYLISQEEVESWLLVLSIEIRQQCLADELSEDSRFLPPDILLDLLFLERITSSEVMDMLMLANLLQNE